MSTTLGTNHIATGDSKLNAAVREYAAKEGLFPSYVVQKAVRKYLAEKGEQR